MPDIRQGWLGNLTPQQEAALKDLWERLGKITHIIPPERPSLDSNSDAASTADVASMSPSTKKKKKRFSMLRRGGGDDDAASAEPEHVDKHGQEKEYKQALADMTPDVLRATIWSFCKGDNPDALLLRFLRARKWDVHNALVMLVSTSHWRTQIKLDEDVMARGEPWFAQQAASGTGPDQKLGADFMRQLELGKSFLHGIDREGRPLCYVRVRLHHASDQGVDAIEKFTVYTIETARLMLREPVDTAGVIFDMSGFSMANMDYTPVKFMIKVFEANYPESLGHICVHRAPWIFNTIWGIIKGWLDPVVASKIHFTKDTAELATWIPEENIPTELGGSEDWSWTYTAPPPDALHKIATASSSPEFAAAQAERASLVEEYERLTLQWVRSDGGAPVAARRQEVARLMAANYWRMDPFVRAPSAYDRAGIIGPGGAINPYPERPGHRGAPPLHAGVAAAAAGQSGKGANGGAVTPAYLEGGAESDDEDGGARSFETAREF